MEKSNNSYQGLVIRADAGTRIGTGHVMRSLALAQAWQDMGAGVTFAMAEGAPTIEKRLKGEGFHVKHLVSDPGAMEDAVETVNLARDLGANWVMADGYHFGSEYLRVVKDSGLHLLFVDDVGHPEHCLADIVLNQNIYAYEGLYPSREPYTRLLLGTKYVLLRNEFSKFRGWTREIPRAARNVLVTMGGADPDNVTLKVIQALNQIDNSELEVKVVVGPSNPHIESLRKELAPSAFSFQLLTSVKDMPKLIAWADTAVSAGGTTCWELAYMGLPGVVVVLAENQKKVAEKLDEEGSVINLGRHDEISVEQFVETMSGLIQSYDRRHRMSQIGKSLVDGMGTDRVLMCIKTNSLRVRRVCEKDCCLLWEWANDTETRSRSFSSDPILWEDHILWFKSKLNDTNCVFYIVNDEDGTPVGQVRYDVNRTKAVISVSIDRRFRGRGYGSRAILLSSQKLFDTVDVSTIHAYVIDDNERSVGAFLKAGFKYAGVAMIDGARAVDLVLIKPSTSGEGPGEVLTIRGSITG